MRSTFLAAAIAAFLALTSTASVGAQCSLSAESNDVAPTRADLYARLPLCEKPEHTWFTWGVNADLSGALRADSTEFHEPGFAIATIKGLEPQTTYYFRAHARLKDGSIHASGIEFFKTIAPTSIRANCRPDSQESLRFRGTIPRYIGRDGLSVAFKCSNAGFHGFVRFRVSKTPTCRMPRTNMLTT